MPAFGLSAFLFQDHDQAGDAVASFRGGDDHHDHQSPLETLRWPRQRQLPSGFLYQKPSFMLLSGVSAGKEMCLVADKHNLGEEGSDVALESCQAVVESGSGRDIWQYQGEGQLLNLMSGKCLTAVPDGTGDAKKLVLQNCDDVSAMKDGRARWHPTPHAQLQCGNRQAYCMTLASARLGSKADEEIDVARGQHATASSTAKGAQDAHDPAQAVDGNGVTYWASMPIEKGEEVTFTVPFAETHLRSVDIDWEFPPNKFELQATTNGHEWHTIYAVRSNPLHSTTSHIPLVGEMASAVRLRLMDPDVGTDSHQHHEGMAYYGIRSLRVNADTRQPVLESCDVAAESPDASDKWFLTSVSEFDSAKAADDRSQLDATRAARRVAAGDESWVLPEKTRASLKGPQAVARWPKIAEKAAATAFLFEGDHNRNLHRPRGTSFTNFPYSAAAAKPEDALRPLALWRQQHRRTEDGYLCSAASVQRSVAFQGCTTMATPEGDAEGREWCYKEPQILKHPGNAKVKRWAYCSPVIDYDKMRSLL
eukprot:TRINITY_DN82236_c0_g1_i1.p1 TRINITY_DN82236_c0_g1~~TRINITY_DN82236_c0_g1_i1.p1  ORF type:complete len:536 (+),score=100.24 TRINITY_DN82236_c0_g1_i1:54-1661(+)